MTEIQNPKQLAFNLYLRFRNCNLVLVICYFRLVRLKAWEDNVPEFYGRQRL